MELASVFSTGCASCWEQGKEEATGSEAQRLLACLHCLSAGKRGIALGRRGCMELHPDCS